MKLFRERLLARLIERHAISEELVRNLLAWRHPGFSAHVVRASRREKEGSELQVKAAPTQRRCPPSWARLISKVYQEQGVPGRPARVQGLQRSAQDRGVHRRVVHQEHPGPSGPEPAGAGITAADPGARPGADRRRGARDPSRLRARQPILTLALRRGYCLRQPRQDDVEEDRMGCVGLPSRSTRALAAWRSR
jgi:hypothetical protein